jgi:AcrR family transcriptional regulator
MISTRERVLDAAWNLFGRQGYAGTTVTQIEAGASLAPGSGSFYRHFRSKEDVLRAVIDREVDRISAERDSRSEPAGAGTDPRVAMALQFQRRLENLRRLQPLMVLIEREHQHLGPSQEHLRELLVERNLTVRSEQLAEWMAAGLIPVRDADALAATVLCAITGYHLAVAFFGRPPGELTETQFVTTLVDLVSGG